MRSCPTCNQPLSVTNFASVHIDACPICGGFWFDNHELAWLTQRAPHRLTELESQYEDMRGLADSGSAPKLCPLCRTPLNPHEFAHSPGISMDICARCHGIWLDHGKLTHIDRRLREYHKAKQQTAATAPDTEPPQPPTQPATATPPQSSSQTSPPGKTQQPTPSEGRVGIASKRKCPKCSAENTPSSSKCAECGERLPLPGRWRPGYCPRCHLGMYPARRCGFIIQACSRCEGVWLPYDLLRELLEQHADILSKFDTNFQLHFHTPEENKLIHRCPDCVIDLSDENFVIALPGQPPDETSVMTHRCPQCNGVWFDAGEMHAIWKHMKDRELIAAG